MKRRLKKSWLIVFSFLITFIIVVILGVCFFVYGLSPVSNSDEVIRFTVDSGHSYLTLTEQLKEEKLIRSGLVYKLYIKMTNPNPVEAGTYELKPSMGVKEIVSVLSGGSQINANVIQVTFPEGKNMRGIARIISENTNNTEDEVFSTLTDQAYLDELIQKYWFLTDEIKNESIYYSLEGYLFPDTYEFISRDVSVKEIFEVMLDHTSEKLEPYKTDIENSSYTMHEMLTLASIVELEASNSDDRAGVAGVFYNRLNNGWSLGSDVTTYYAVKIEMSDRDLYQSELDDFNAYNTRSSQMAGMLPVSPICNPGLESIVAAINPTSHNYYYFVADKNKKTYFSTSSYEHDSTISWLRSEGLWFEY